MTGVPDQINNFFSASTPVALINKIKDEGTAVQTITPRQAYMDGMGSPKDASRGKAKEDPSSADESQREEDTSNDPWKGLADSLKEKHDKAVEKAVTFQVDNNDRPMAPTQKHYSRHNDFESGELFRIWYPENIETHLSTFMVIHVQRTNISCLRVVYPPDKPDGAFHKIHTRLKVEKWKGNFGRKKQRDDDEELIVYMQDDQRLGKEEKDCYLNLRYPWNIDWQADYLFVKCGWLQKTRAGKLCSNIWITTLNLSNTS